MKKYLLPIAFLLFISCAKQTENVNETTDDAIITEQEDNEIVEENISESFRGLQDGSYTVPDEIRTHLRTFCNYDVNTQKGDFEYQSIAKDANEHYTQACDYDAVGTYLINTDENVDQSFIASNGFPFLEHSFQDPNIYLIEEINISELGRKMTMTVRYMPFDANTGYSVDMSVATEKVELTINDAEQMLLTDRVFTDEPRYFIESKQLDQLPTPACDEDYR